MTTIYTNSNLDAKRETAVFYSFESLNIKKCPFIVYRFVHADRQKIDTLINKKGME